MPLTSTEQNRTQRHPQFVREEIAELAKQQIARIEYVLHYHCFLPADCLAECLFQLQRCAVHAGRLNAVANRAIRQQAQRYLPVTHDGGAGRDCAARSCGADDIEQDEGE